MNAHKTLAAGALIFFVAGYFAGQPWSLFEMVLFPLLLAIYLRIPERSEQ